VFGNLDISGSVSGIRNFILGCSQRHSALAYPAHFMHRKKLFLFFIGQEIKNIEGIILKFENE